MTEYKWVFYSFASLFFLVVNYSINKLLGENYQPFTALLITGLAQTLIATLLYALSSESMAQASVSFVFLSIGIAVCVIGIDYFMMAAFNAGGNSIIVTLIVSMATVAMVPVGMIFFKDRVSTTQIIGIVLSIVSLVLVILYPKK